jgi:hypothetical protein
MKTKTHFTFRVDIWDHTYWSMSPGVDDLPTGRLWRAG